MITPFHRAQQADQVTHSSENQDNLLSCSQREKQCIYVYSSVSESQAQRALERVSTLHTPVSPKASLSQVTSNVPTQSTFYSSKQGVFSSLIKVACRIWGKSKVLFGFWKIRSIYQEGVQAKESMPNESSQEGAERNRDQGEPAQNNFQDQEAKDLDKEDNVSQNSRQAELGVAKSIDCALSVESVVQAKSHEARGGELQQESLKQESVVQEKTGIFKDRAAKGRAASQKESFVSCQELIRATSDGLYAFPVKTKSELLEENAEKIALIHRLLGASAEEWEHIVLPMLHGCLKLSMVLPASEVQHDSYQGGLFAHSLNVAVSCVEECESSLNLDGMGRGESIESALCLYEQLQLGLKDAFSHYVLPCTFVSKGLDQLAWISQYKIFDSLDLNSTVAKKYLQEQFKYVAKFEQQFRAVVSDNLRRIWGQGLFAANEQEKSRVSLAQSTLVSNEQDLNLRYLRNKLLESSLAVPCFSVNDFISLQSLSPIECKAVLECLGGQSQYYRNLQGDLAFDLLADLGLFVDITSDFDAHRKQYAQKFGQISVDLVYNVRTSNYVSKAQAELAQRFPYLNTYQISFCIKSFCLFFALVHDLGKVIADMTVFSDSGIKFNPLRMNLDQFVELTQTKVLWIDYVEDRSINHALCLSTATRLLARECPAAFNFISRFFNVDKILIAYKKRLESKRGALSAQGVSEVDSLGLLKLVLKKDIKASIYTRNTLFLYESLQKLLLGCMLNHYSHYLYGLDQDNDNQDKRQAHCQDACCPSHIFGQLSSSVSCDLTVRSWLNQGQSLNNPYADFFVSATEFLVVKDSRTHVYLTLLQQELELGKLKASDLMIDGEELAEALKQSFKASLDTGGSVRYFKICCGQDLILTRGIRIKPCLYRVGLPLAKTEFLEISAECELISLLMSESINIMQAILESLKECKRYALLTESLQLGEFTQIHTAMKQSIQEQSHQKLPKESSVVQEPIEEGSNGVGDKKAESATHVESVEQADSQLEDRVEGIVSSNIKHSNRATPCSLNLNPYKVRITGLSLEEMYEVLHDLDEHGLPHRLPDRVIIYNGGHLFSELDAKRPVATYELRNYEVEYCFDPKAPYLAS